MPSRTYNILAVGKPILAMADEDSELGHVVREDNVGWIVPPEDPARLTSVLLEIIKRRDHLPQMGEAARRAAMEKYSLDVALEKYRNEM